MMWQEMDSEFAVFKRAADSGKLILDEYFHIENYKDRYSIETIEKYQMEFALKVREYLHEYYADQYIIIVGSSVQIMTVYEAKRRNVPYFELRIVK